MKRLALAAVVLSIAACSSQDETPAADTSMTAPAMAPAPAAPADSMAMPMDSAMVDTTADTTMMDTSVTPPPAQ
ncbi:MAG TPA: hypothetical protein VGE02_10780 [Gemmatimonadales bacterium]